MAGYRSARERQRDDLARKISKRPSYDRILIVCEGSKTEPNYFNEIRIFHKLPTATVAVFPSATGTEPIQVVEYAHTLFKNGDRANNIEPCAFEKVFAVFDRDEHQTYFQALDKALSLDRNRRNDSKQEVEFKAIASIPSFELWLLLHFEDVQAPIHRDDALRRLKGHVQGYEKGNRGVFTTTKAHLEIAKSRAQILATKFTAYTDPEPFTAVHEVVTLLTKLRR